VFCSAPGQLSIVQWRAYSSGKLRIGIGAETKFQRCGWAHLYTITKAVRCCTGKAGARGLWVVSYTMELRDAVAGAEGKARDKRIGGNRQELVA